MQILSPGKQADAQKYTATGGILNKDYGDIATEAEVLGKVTTDAPDEKINSKIVIGDIPASGKNQAVDVVVTSADNTTDTVKVIVTYGDAKDIYDPAGKNITVEIGEPANAEEGIGNKDQLPENTDYTWKQPIDTNSVGNRTGIIVVTYPDGSKEEVKIPVIVVKPKEENPVNDNQKSQTSSDNSQNGKKSGTDDSNSGKTKTSSSNSGKAAANAQNGRYSKCMGIRSCYLRFGRCDPLEGNSGRNSFDIIGRAAHSSPSYEEVMWDDGGSFTNYGIVILGYAVSS